MLLNIKWQNVVVKTEAQRFVKYALQIGALELVPELRTLKSGRKSPYFFNSGLFNTGESLQRLAAAYAAAAKANFAFDVVFGPAYKGIPLAVATALSLGGKIEYAFDRKEEKDHGEGGKIVGASLESKGVLVIDDVATTGKSLEQALNAIRESGGLPVGCVVAFDRQERGAGSLSAVQELQEKFGIRVCSAANLDDLICVLGEAYMAEVPRQPTLDILNQIKAYRREYGV